MEQFKKIVLEAPEGKIYDMMKEEGGRLIVLRLLPDSSQDKATYFTKITAKDRKKVKAWLRAERATTEREGTFLERVREAMKVVDYDYWIANLEPSVFNGKIYYAEGENVGVGFSCNQWKQMAKKFAPERGSRLANLHELFIWYALRIANGLWTLRDVAESNWIPSRYYNEPGYIKCIRKTTGARKHGGYYDGPDNSYKIVTSASGERYNLVGGICDDRHDRGYHPIARVYDSYVNGDETRERSSGVLVLTK